ncbi:hypothetical protein L1F30_09580 [Simiduia sp. 21SJ11W-1]|uniref:hypothetical protein n=1 Tax=Simiduia sp. 21SJ11W-1 TaxID=2909669 RepID=UPI0020A18B52|nr:hypothetical protein [Simiduia sp. 21SJ11W-1]UTA46424.1 hypothetical protein L1F30_09580 [Simiduia sp. 21SJ11W-1]
MKFIVLFIFTVPVALASEDINQNVLQPEAVVITEMEGSKMLIDGELYYRVFHCMGCMDEGYAIYDSNGNSVCSFVGIAGTLDSKCEKLMSKMDGSEHSRN